MATLETVYIKNKFKEFHIDYLIGLRAAIQQLNKVYNISEPELKVIAAIEQLTAQGLKIVTCADVCKLLGTSIKTYNLVRKLEQKNYITKEKVGKRKLHLTISLSGKMIERSYSDFMTNYSRKNWLKQRIFQRELLKAKNAMLYQK
jgi:DNA-binding MarR family transcriptional regulator